MKNYFVMVGILFLEICNLHVSALECRFETVQTLIKMSTELLIQIWFGEFIISAGFNKICSNHFINITGQNKDIRVTGLHV